MADWLLRLRALLDKQFAVVVVALVVLALVGGWMTYTVHATPHTTTEERSVSSWQTTAWFNHSATVTGNNSVYPVGSTLTNRSIYFTELTPWLNGTYTFTYAASESGDLNGTVSLQLVLRGVEEGSQSTTVVWRTTKPIRRNAIGSLEPGETIRTPFSINMNETVNQMEVIETELSNPPGQSEVVIRATVDFYGTVNSESVDRVKTHTLPITFESGTYRVGAPEKLTEQHEATRTVTVEQTYGPVRSIGAPVLFLASLFALVGLVVARTQNRLGLSPAERERLHYEDERDDFDEWISAIQLPDDAFDRPRAEATSLSALVDFAIDTDNRVIEDPDDDAYYVVHNGYLYSYGPPTPDDETGRYLQTDGEYDTSEETGGESISETATEATVDAGAGSPDGTATED